MEASKRNTDFQKGSKKDPGNYRPVSLTSVPGKMLESILKTHIMNHVVSNNLIKSSQHGFLAGRSCLTNLLEYLEYVTSQLDKRNPVDVIFLDFSKAFDKVPHQRLLSKLKSHGITGQCAKWIENWLTNRKQRVVLNGKQSQWSCVTSGVPQGSVLGPLLFLIYVNDMDDGLSCNISKFADDTKIYSTVRDTQEGVQMQNDLDKLLEWSRKWQMQFNTSKCKTLHFGKSNPKCTYLMNSETLRTDDHEKDLGVEIHTSLKPEKHIDTVVSKANRILGMINRSVQYKGKDCILPLYTALVRPHLEYAVQAWAPHYNKDIEKIENVQKRALKMISDAEISNIGYEDKLRKLKLFSMEKRRLRGDLIETFKIMKDIDKIASATPFTKSTYTRTRGHEFKLVKSKVRTDIRKYFFS